MMNWLNYFKKGMSREVQVDQISKRQETINFKEVVQRLLPYLKPHWRTGLLGAGLIVFSSLLAFPQPLINRFMIDDVILAQQLDLLPWAVLLLGGSYLLNKAVGMLNGYTISLFEQRVILDIQATLLKHTLTLPKAFFDKKEVGYLISRISSDVQGLRWFFSGTVVYLFTKFVQLIGGIGFLFYLEWKLAIAAIIALPFLAISVRYFSNHMRTLSHHTMETNANIMKRLQETITSLPLIKTFTTETKESERVIESYKDNVQLSLESKTVSSIANLAINSVPDLAKAVVIVVGAIFVIRGEWTLGSLYAFQSYLGYVFGPALFFASSNLSMQNSLAALERVLSILDVVPEENLDSGLEVDHLRGEINFDNVSFSYGGDEPVLEDISFDIHPGEHVAIVGPSGVGKTTLASLLLCFYQPMRGEILFDGKPTSEYNLGSLRKRIGYVSQSTLLLSGTFRENLVYGFPDASHEEIVKASKVAGIHDFIDSLPNQYDSRIDERGVNLSEGQKQRLSIARALIKDPDILILDEPTAALDSIIERSIFQSLPEMIHGKTLIVIAHRLATIQDSDQILLLNEKRLVGVGTHAQLLEENAFYRELVANQQVLGSS